MKFYLLLILPFVFSFSVFTQTREIIATTKDGRVVILKPDGTWIFKKIVTQQLSTASVKSVKQENDKVSLSQIENVVKKEFGSKLEISDAFSNVPLFLFGDFNGDAYADIAVLVNVEQGRAELKEHSVKYVSNDSYSRSNGSQLNPVTEMGNNCLGIAIIHGTESGWNSPNSDGKFLIYDCFSAFKIFRKGKKVIRGGGSKGTTPILKGDSIFLELENGGTTLVYWNGQTYRGFGLRGGD